MPDYKKLMYDIEVHSVKGISNYFIEGGSPNEVYNGQSLFSTMVEMYTRTPRFKECIRVFVEAGLQFKEQALLAVLLDDAEKLNQLLLLEPEMAAATYSLFSNTYTPLTGAGLLHYCAEYNSVKCARVLVKNGADVNARAGIDVYGFGGQTPIFHTLNQNNNNSSDMLNFLLEN